LCFFSFKCLLRAFLAKYGIAVDINILFVVEPIGQDSHTHGGRRAHY
jgi:hypothetical protein